MKEKIDSLICTVGTSLVGHWRKGETWLNKKIKNNNVDSYDKLLNALRVIEKEKIPDSDGKEENPGNPEFDKRFGAEINSIESLINKKYTTELQKLTFFVSDTDDGIETGKLLEKYYEKKKINTCYKVIEGLQHQDEKEFRKTGLRNLVKFMVEEINKLKKENYNPGINATGGYKAQIAFAVLIGQVMKVPVFYRFDRFPEIISLPPLPVNYDFVMWEEYYQILKDANDDTLIRKDDIPFDKEPSLEILFDVEGENAILSGVGIVFFEAFRNFIWEKIELPQPSEKSVEERLKNIYLENSGHLKGWGKFINFSKKLIENCNFIEALRTTYVNPDLPKKINFRKPTKGEINEIEFTYSDGTKTVKGLVITTAKTHQQQIRAIEELNSIFTQ